MLYDVLCSSPPWSPCNECFCSCAVPRAADNLPFHLLDRHSGLRTSANLRPWHAVCAAAVGGDIRAPGALSRSSHNHCRGHLVHIQRQGLLPSPLLQAQFAADCTYCPRQRCLFSLRLNVCCHSRGGPLPTALPSHHCHNATDPAAPAGTPLEPSKRPWVTRLSWAYLSTLPINAGLLAYSAWVVLAGDGSCWSSGNTSMPATIVFGAIGVLVGQL
jgi:hypothetical protein